ncbi:methionine biosynthesis protein MetW [Desulforhopalus singaporensis]|uniref:Methionine biosynthesis protein MetW n=1 Tax=Desulforhopalus singaporensis TaxID=91360 RepID=A0A1H0UNB0_9BACT|nr:methionine biosynthesis protein MetW [Desulforhopalus singaporensis]SDP67573.1 methionine biosynthesis protein MetW [Desulforhopalus singaporensis]
MESAETTRLRFDLRIIASIIPENSRVLDLGCGNGDLLEWLARNKNIAGTGIEMDKQKAARCIARGLSVLQGDLNDEVDDYPDCSFDYVILSQTLQQVFEPARLLYSLARIGRKVIVSFPNFSHYSIRLQLLTRGMAPKNDQLPYSWYDTPNIRVITLKDFRKFSRDVGYNILKEITIATNRSNEEGKVIGLFPDLRATYGIYIIEKNRM